MRRLHAVALAVGLLPAGCIAIGPDTVSRDRFDYNEAISTSWKEQSLLNIVKLRYADMPLFVEVASVVAGYTLEGSVNVAGTIQEGGTLPDFLSLGSTGKYTDRPTITYAPITGQQFNKNFMTPIPPRAILFLMQSGWPADLILPITVEALNGLRSRVLAGSNQRQGNPGFYRAIELLREIQRSGAVAMHLVKEEDDSEATVIVLAREDVPAETQAAIDEVAEILGLEPGAREIQVSYGLLPRTASELTLLTRSMLHIMIELATRVEVPEEDIVEGRTVPALAVTPQGPEPLMRIRHSPGRPAEAFAAVRYRGSWFWIDDRDYASKRTFAFLMILFSLMETGGDEGLPLVTIPAG